ESSDGYVPKQKRNIRKNLKEKNLINFELGTLTTLHFRTLNLDQWREETPFAFIPVTFIGKYNSVNAVSDENGNIFVKLPSGDYDVVLKSDQIEDSYQRHEVKKRNQKIDTFLIPEGWMDWYHHNNMFYDSNFVFDENGKIDDSFLRVRGPPNNGAMQKWPPGVIPHFYISINDTLFDNPDSNRVFYEKFIDLMTKRIKGDFNENFKVPEFPEGFFKDSKIETGKDFWPPNAEKVRDFYHMIRYFPYIVVYVVKDNLNPGLASSGSMLNENGEIIMGAVGFTVSPKKLKWTIGQYMKHYDYIFNHEFLTAAVDARCRGPPYETSVLTGWEPPPREFTEWDKKSVTLLFSFRPVGTGFNYKLGPEYLYKPDFQDFWMNFGKSKRGWKFSFTAAAGRKADTDAKTAPQQP
ncbi:MAG: hypothetical protein ONB12_12950, partial [candidate division KSB1 bacterium]|nr:hypothetical protein [candidate division KSB1 bacterium]